MAAALEPVSRSRRSRLSGSSACAFKYWRIAGAFTCRLSVISLETKKPARKLAGLKKELSGLETERAAEPDRAIASIRASLLEAVGQTIIAKASPLLRQSCVLKERIHAGEDCVVEGIQHAHTEFEGRTLRNLESLEHTEIGDVGNRVVY